MSGELTSSQRKFLRSLARRQHCDMTVGKRGPAENVIRHVRRLLDRQELVKLRLLQTAAEDRRAAAATLAEGAEAALVDLVGRVVVLYRPAEELPPDRRIQLPGQ